MSMVLRARFLWALAAAVLARSAGPGALQAAVNAVPLPVRRGLARAWHYPFVSFQPSADQVVLAQKSLEIDPSLAEAQASPPSGADR